MRKIINENFIVISGQKFNIKFQLFKVDLPCRSLSICIKQHNGYYCCSNCLQRGKTVGGTCVYYSSDEMQVMHFYENIQDVVNVTPLLDKYREDISVVYQDEKRHLYSLHGHKYPVLFIR
ncbi:unnamed protein product [Rotaria socialis]|nr:unnamed protein product [Rotaria socialis]